MLRVAELEEGRREDMRRYSDRSEVECTPDVGEGDEDAAVWLEPSAGGELVWRVGVIAEAEAKRETTEEGGVRVSWRL